MSGLGDHDAPLPFTVAMSFLMGVVTTIAVYSVGTKQTSPPTAGVHASEQPAAPVAPTEDDAIDQLRSRHLMIPVEGIDRADLRNTYSDARGLRTHEALDIMAPRGREVHAVEDGRIQKLFTSAAGGLTIYEFDPSETFAYYYAHLDRYANGLQEGHLVRRGDVIGYVGSSGNASPDAPHLHFAIFRLGPERQWWRGDPINPYPVFTQQ
jgi:murein DD-endopeptidase MepM/ murein hydrolase activator NlpD